MAFEPISFDDLLKPISDEHPTGLPLRDESSGSMRDFYNVRDAASEARSAERKLATYIPPPAGEEDPYKPLPPNWTAVYDTAVDILSKKSKDLWVVAWMIEAICRLQGFVGLRDGFKLARELCDRFWDDLHPRGPEGDVDHLVAQLAGLNGVDGEGALIDPLKAVPITSGRGRGPYSYADFLAAARLEQEADPERRQKRIADGEVSMEQFEAAAAESPPDFYTDLLVTIDAVITEFDQLNELLEQRCRVADADYSRAPPSSNISSVLSEIRRRVALLAGENEAGDEQGEEQAQAGDTGDNSQMPKIAAGQIASRDEAFRLILKIAEYFEKSEPHSPVSYGLRQVVHWGRLSLPELLMQLIDNAETRDQLFRHIGIAKPTDSES